MSIFGKIKDAIFGKNGGPFGDGYIGGKKPETTPGQAPAQHDKPAMPQMQKPSVAAPGAGLQAPAAPAAQAPAAPKPVDANARIEEIARQKGNPNLNYKSSIVDLMKLLDLDSSLENRKELATELGYTGAKDGSAEMNLWLHKRVMEELSKSGGTVPASLKD